MGSHRLEEALLASPVICGFVTNLVDDFQSELMVSAHDGLPETNDLLGDVIVVPQQLAELTLQRGGVAGDDG